MKKFLLDYEDVKENEVEFEKGFPIRDDYCFTLKCPSCGRLKDIKINKPFHTANFVSCKCGKSNIFNFDKFFDVQEVTFIYSLERFISNIDRIEKKLLPIIGYSHVNMQKMFIYHFKQLIMNNNPYEAIMVNTGDSKLIKVLDDAIKHIKLKIIIINNKLEASNFITSSKELRSYCKHIEFDKEEKTKYVLRSDKLTIVKERSNYLIKYYDECVGEEKEEISQDLNLFLLNFKYKLDYIYSDKYNDDVKEIIASTNVICRHFKGYRLFFYVKLKSILKERRDMGDEEFIHSIGRWTRKNFFINEIDSMHIEIKEGIITFMHEGRPFPGDGHVKISALNKYLNINKFIEIYTRIYKSMYNKDISEFIIEMDNPSPNIILSNGILMQSIFNRDLWDGNINTFIR